MDHKDVNNGLFSSTLKTTGVENENDEAANTYSIIGDLTENIYKIDGKYQFKMIYRYSDGTRNELIWKQSSWLTDSTITGYEPISIPTENNCDSTSSCNFEGLGLSSNAKSYLDGDASAHTNWNNAALATS